MHGFHSFIMLHGWFSLGRHEQSFFYACAGGGMWEEMGERGTERKGGEVDEYESGSGKVEVV